MLKPLLILLFLHTAISQVSAAELRIDGTSKETYERSLGAMIDSLNKRDMDAFQKGLINLIVTRYPPAKGAVGRQILRFLQPAIAAAPTTLNGITKSEILAHGRMVVTSLNNLKSPLLKCLRKKVVLTGAVIENDGKTDYLKFDVTNNLTWSVSGIIVKYTIQAKNSSIPWKMSLTAPSISGGVGPGETRSIRVAVSKLPSPRTDDVFTFVELYNVADPEKRLLLAEIQADGSTGEKSNRTCQDE